MSYFNQNINNYRNLNKCISSTFFYFEKHFSTFPAREKGFFVNSPITSFKKGKTNIHFKLDNLQPSGSFKDRGISHMIYTLSKQVKISKLVSSSGGNAGKAVTFAGSRLKVPVKVFVPSTTSSMMQDLLKSHGADVVVAGDYWDAADKVAREYTLKEGPEALYIPPFDHELIWQGNSSIVHELIDYGLHDIDLIVVAVGGGGLLCGVQKGIEDHNLVDKTSVLAFETQGAASFAAALKVGKPVKIDKIDSIAKSLGALAVTPGVFKYKTKVESVLVTDEDAVKSCLLFADQFRFLVEPACGAALSAVFNDQIFDKYLSSFNNVVVVVCGGSAVSLDIIESWKKSF